MMRSKAPFSDSAIPCAIVFAVVTSCPEAPEEPGHQPERGRLVLDDEDLVAWRCRMGVVGAIA